MIDPNGALDRLRQANLLPTTAPLEGEELAAVIAECEERIALERGTAAGRSQRTEETLRPAPAPRRRWRPALVFSLAFVALLVGVGVVALFAGSSDLVLEQDVASDTAQPTTTLPIRTIGNVAYVDDLEYYADAELTLEMSVFFPAEGDGPWPVVVVYSEFAVNRQERDLAQLIAERGAVVFAPVWVDETAVAQTVGEYLTGATWDRAACAVGYAQAQAEVLGGDPTLTTLVGDAGGEHPAAWAALGLADTSACQEPIVFQPTGLVVGESQWLFQEERFDPAFAAEDAAAADTVDRFFNPERWGIAEELNVFLWATSWSRNSNEIDDPPAADSWITSRDLSGTIVEDLAAVGAFDDGLITFSDNSRLMRLRMMQAGLNVSFFESDDPEYDLLDDGAIDNIWSLISGG